MDMSEVRVSTSLRCLVTWWGRAGHQVGPARCAPVRAAARPMDGGRAPEDPDLVRHKLHQVGDELVEPRVGPQAGICRPLGCGVQAQDGRRDLLVVGLHFAREDVLDQGLWSHHATGKKGRMAP